jgi:hypothetical protein
MVAIETYHWLRPIFGSCFRPAHEPISYQQFIQKAAVTLNSWLIVAHVMYFLPASTKKYIYHCNILCIVGVNCSGSTRKFLTTVDSLRLENSK